MAYGQSRKTRALLCWFYRVWFHTKLYTGPQEVNIGKLSRLNSHQSPETCL
jgi:hypothetical protein